MSADLFAAFGETEQQKWSSNSASNTPQTPAQPSHSLVLPVSQSEVNDEDDDFGDFEGENPWSEAFGQESLEMRLPSTSHPVQHQRSVKEDTPQAVGSNVLFDADEPPEPEQEDDEDDFGDFEDSKPISPPVKPPTKVSQYRAPQTSSNDLDLLGLDEALPTPSQSAPPKPKSKSAKSTPKPSVQTSRPPPPRSPQIISSSTETWDDFSTTTPASPTKPPAQSQSFPFTIPPTLLSSMHLPPPSPSPLPPSNIPPPSILLPLFPPLFTQLSTALTPLLSLPTPTRTAHLLSSPVLHLLQSHFSLLRVLSHIIAARKLRWRRDKRLAQSMAIGPSVSGRSGGMKLAGVDKGEQGREEVEVREAVRAYKAHVGGLRSVVGAVNAAINPAPTGQKGKEVGTWGDLGELIGGEEGVGRGKEADGAGKERKRVLPAVPDIGEAMPVRTGTRGEGAVVSTAGCGLCGMKREERVQKVDGVVEDSFGEWWIEGTNMHTECWRFWEGFKGMLNQK
ncbi:Isocitrate dehydrogenase [Elsinoe australis]|uniref:Isocitrate dehydrogenase n=1 Tax=Elsinoe australis TaxID=40998 RepID=A0A2P7Z2M2_9PEZI|nr:Isocitrate dehydrogenase [Elsinoe australis]